MAPRVVAAAATPPCCGSDRLHLRFVAALEVLGGRPGGAGLMKALGTPDVTPELKKTIAEGVSQMAGGHSVEQLAQEENKLLAALIKLRAQQARVLASEAHA